ncbi:CdaR family transcriptional regulator [Yokenella regensburgei]|uniref:CdaR family transcriptional regulator n=1 Tax=Yokenella regensburgei TaxID=158877 RepID=A0ABX9RZK9_9ENTR|nr:sugar diacid recognition domain-containing protein [Yokenella regensburgei]RKR63471.1 CdaR family transcriptional regulator [Yokenella regensburgei]VFS35271.1 Sugar diacid regulator [Yokenella regensburgei]
MKKRYLKDYTARQIVERAMRIIPYSVNVMDEHGIIIASGEPSRLHQRHEGAILALKDNRVVEIDTATAAQLKGVRPGINLPVSFHGQMIGVVGITGEPGEVRAYAELVKMASELVIEHMVLIEQKEWDKRYREELINQLIMREPPPESLHSMVSYLGIDLRQPRVVAIIELRQPDREALRNLMEYFENRARDHLVTFTDFNELIIIKPISRKDGNWDLVQEMKDLQCFKSWASSSGFSRIVVGGYFSGDNGLHRSWQTARATQAMVKRQKVKNQYVFYHDYALPALLSDVSESWQVQELSRLWQHLVEHDAKGVLQQTLREWFAHNCDLSQTAKALHIHVNTLRYRLQRCEEITGIKINNLKSILWLFIGMELQCQAVESHNLAPRTPAKVR